MKKDLSSPLGINDSDIITQRVVDGKRIFHPVYLKWRNMLRRCLVKHKKHQYYESVSVCNEWYYLSNFISWVGDTDVTGLYLDKDILGDGKIYSPESCAFVTQECNQFFSSVKKNGKYMIGVAKETRLVDTFYCHYKGRYVGSFRTETDAHKAWQIEKRNHAKSLAISEQDVRIRQKLQDIIAKIEYDILKGEETCALT